MCAYESRKPMDYSAGPSKVARVEFTMAIDRQCDYAKANERKFQIEGKEVV